MDGYTQGHVERKARRFTSCTLNPLFSYQIQRNVHPMAPSSEIFIDDILKKSLIFKEKRLDLIGRENDEQKQ